MEERYYQKEGQLIDGCSNTAIPFDIYWIVDLLNIKENRIRELESELDES